MLFEEEFQLTITNYLNRDNDRDRGYDRGGDRRGGDRDGSRGFDRYEPPRERGGYDRGKVIHIL